MKDRARLNNGRSSKMMCPSDYSPADFATFLANLKAGTVYVDVTANNSTGIDAGVSEVGTALNKANLLSDTTASGFGFEATDDPTVDDVLERIGADYISGTLNAGQTSLTLLDSRFKTTSTIDIYSSQYGVAPKTATLADGSLTLTFKSYANAITIRVRVY